MHPAGHRLPKDAYSFLDQILVECPRCERLAYVIPKRRDEPEPARLVCSSCGYISTEIKPTWYYDACRLGVDPIFSRPLWLREPLRQGVVWAFNWRHLEDLRFFVEGDWRQHRHGLGFKGYSPLWSYRLRLPKWMQLRANHRDMLRAMDRIERRRLGR